MNSRSIMTSNFISIKALEVKSVYFYTPFYSLRSARGLNSGKMALFINQMSSNFYPPSFLQCTYCLLTGPNNQHVYPCWNIQWKAQNNLYIMMQKALNIQLSGRKKSLEMCFSFTFPNIPYLSCEDVCSLSVKINIKKSRYNTPPMS